MILTRCPSCAAGFRITPEQLKLRGGRVRCGRCHTAFDAIAGLIDPSLPPTDVTDLSLASGPVMAVGSVPGQAERVATLSEPDSAAARIEAQDLPASIRDARSPRPAEGPEFASVGATVPPGPGEISSPPDADLGTATTAWLAADQAPGAAPASEQGHAVAGQADTVPALAEILPILPDKRKRSQNLLWAAGSCLAALVLLAQATYVFRAEIAHAFPGTRAWLQSACERMGCKVALPSVADLIGVESSELHPDPNDKQKLTFVATLKNRAAFAQTFPHLELTLTDTRGQAVVRRVFTPSEYLGTVAVPERGIGANADQVVRLDLAVTASGATGYLAYVFYP